MMVKQRCLIIFLVLCLSVWGETVLADSEIAIFPLQVAKQSGSQYTVPDRDPFNWPAAQQAEIARKAALPQKVFDQLTLQAIFWDDIPLAVINQTSIFEGDKIGEVTVRRIEQDKVVVELNGHQYVLHFEENIIDFNFNGHQEAQPLP